MIERIYHSITRLRLVSRRRSDAAGRPIDRIADRPAQLATACRSTSPGTAADLIAADACVSTPRRSDSLRLSLLPQVARFRAPPAVPLPAARLPLRASPSGPAAAARPAHSGCDAQ